MTDEDVDTAGEAERFDEKPREQRTHESSDRTALTEDEAAQERFRQRVLGVIEGERRGRFWKGSLLPVAVIVLAAFTMLNATDLNERVDKLEKLADEHCISVEGRWHCSFKDVSLTDRVERLERDEFVADETERLNTALEKAQEAGLSRIDCTSGIRGSGTWTGPSVLVDRDGQWWFEADWGPDEDLDKAADSAVGRLGWKGSEATDSDQPWLNVEPCLRAIHDAIDVLAQVQGDGGR